MNKKVTIIAAIALLTIGIGAVIYLVTRPVLVSTCDSLLWKMIEARTEAEHDYAEKRWNLVCGIPTNQP